MLCVGVSLNHLLCVGVSFLYNSKTTGAKELTRAGF